MDSVHLNALEDITDNSTITQTMEPALDAQTIVKIAAVLTLATCV
jgi:hypothetical protein